MIGIKDKKLTDSAKVIFFVFAVILLYILVQPLVTVLLASVILTFLFYPLFKKLTKVFRFEGLSVIVTYILILAMIVTPIAFIVVNLPAQASGIYEIIDSRFLNADLDNIICDIEDSFLCMSAKYLQEQQFIDLDQMFDNIFSVLIDVGTKMVVGIPSALVSIVLMFFISYFMFKDAPKLLASLKESLPLRNKQIDALFARFSKVTNSVVFAHIIVAIAQGAVGALGFYLFGVSQPIFWGILMAFFGLLPIIGTAFVWVPVSVFLLIVGLVANDFIVMGRAIGIFLYGLLIISTIDNLLRVKLVGETGDVHPLAVIIGIIGGIGIFGFMGIFIGPIVLSILLTFFHDFSRSYVE